MYPCVKYSRKRDGYNGRKSTINHSDERSPRGFKTALIYMLYLFGGIFLPPNETRCAGSRVHQTRLANAVWLPGACSKQQIFAKHFAWWTGRANIALWGVFCALVAFELGPYNNHCVCMAACVFVGFRCRHSYRLRRRATGRVLKITITLVLKADDVIALMSLWLPQTTHNDVRQALCKY